MYTPLMPIACDAQPALVTKVTVPLYQSHSLYGCGSMQFHGCILAASLYLNLHAHERSPESTLGCSS